MELEAVRNALKAVKDLESPPTIIVATDSMAILCKIQSGYLPGEWFDLRDAHPTIKVIWLFVPSYSEVVCNETRSRTLCPSMAHSSSGGYVGYIV